MQEVCEKGLIIYNTCLAGNDSELEMGIASRNQEFQASLINECLLGRKKPFVGTAAVQGGSHKLKCSVETSPW